MTQRLLGDISAKDAAEPFGTAALPDAVVNRRYIITVATGDWRRRDRAAARALGSMGLGR